MYLYSILLVCLLPAIGHSRRRGYDDNFESDVFPGVDVYPARNQKSATFGEVYKPGYGDMNRLKQIAEQLDLEGKTTEEKRRLLKLPKAESSEKPALSPRDKFLQGEDAPIKTKNKKYERPVMFNFPLIHARNVATPSSVLKKAAPKRKRPFQDEGPGPSPEDFEGKHSMFFRGSFDLVSDANKDRPNWTTCDEFGRMASFHPKDIVDLDWVPFYIWSERPHNAAIVHRFTYPTKKIVKRFKEEYGPHVNQSIDWDQPKLMLRELRNVLLIAGDRKGLFYMIPEIDLPVYAKTRNLALPISTLRMKIEDPYLVLMYCQEEYAAAMAISGNEPTTDEEKIAEAATIKFRGIGKPVERDLESEESAARAAKEREDLKPKDYLELDPDLYRKAVKRKPDFWVSV